MNAILLKQSYMLNTSSYRKKTDDHMQLYLSKLKYVLSLRLYFIGIYHQKKLRFATDTPPLVFHEISKQGGVSVVIPTDCKKFKIHRTGAPPRGPACALII